MTFGIELVVLGFVIGFAASAINAAISGASFGEAMEAGLMGGAIGAVTAPIGAALLKEAIGPALNGVAGSFGATGEQLGGALLFTGGLGQSSYSATQGNYTGLIAIGLAGAALLLAKGAQASGGKGGDGTEAGEAPLTGASPEDVGPQKLEGIKVYRKDIDIGADDKYGHWWLKVDETESYGWWPKDHVSVKETILGVEGELNGQTTFGGTALRDPHHFDGTGKVFDVYAKDQFVPRGVVVGQIRNFAQSYSGGWSWPLGQNCHSFQSQLLGNLHLELRPAGLAP
jgi:hypothetical protein